MIFLVFVSTFYSSIPKNIFDGGYCKIILAFRNNPPNYIIWFNIARDALLGDLGFSINNGEELGYLLPVIEVSCIYKCPARYGDTVIVVAEADPITVAKLIVNYRVIRKKDRRILAIGKTVSVLTDIKGRIKIKFPVDIEGNKSD